MPPGNGGGACLPSAAGFLATPPVKVNSSSIPPERASRDIARRMMARCNPARMSSRRCPIERRSRSSAPAKTVQVLLIFTLLVLILLPLILLLVLLLFLLLFGLFYLFAIMRGIGIVRIKFQCLVVGLDGLIVTAKVRQCIDYLRESMKTHGDP